MSSQHSDVLREGGETVTKPSSPGRPVSEPTHPGHAFHGEVESALGAIWIDILGLERLGRDDNFFALGGHSLHAIRVLSRVSRTFGLDVPLATLFRHPSVSALAQAMVAEHLCPSEARGDVIGISSPDEVNLPLSFSQRRLWLLARIHETGANLNIRMKRILKGQLDREALVRSLNDLFARHDALRSVFVIQGGALYVNLLPTDSAFPLVEYDLRDSSAPDEGLERLEREERMTAFDLLCGPLIRGALVRVSEDLHVFLLSAHHIVFDGWSLNVLVRELSVSYAAYNEGRRSPLDPLAMQFSDYASWQCRWHSLEKLPQQADYWRRTLANPPGPLNLPTDRRRPSLQSFDGAAIPIWIEPELSHNLRRFSQDRGVTLFMTLLAAWGVVLARLAGQESLIVGTTTAGRTRPDLEGLIGCFINTLPLRLNIVRDLDADALVAHVRQVTLDAQRNQDLAFEQVLELTRPDHRLDRTPLFQVLFDWHNDGPEPLQLPNLVVENAKAAVQHVNFDLHLDLYEEAGGITGTLRYATALFDQATIARQVGYLVKVLDAFVGLAGQQVGVHRFQLLSDLERSGLLRQGGHIDVDRADEACVHELFEKQVERTPRAVALVCEKHELTYEDLNRRANSLAHHLAACGVTTETRVAICLERGPAFVIALIAVLKAGGAYVPLDPKYPDQRLLYLLKDSEASVLITHSSIRYRLDEHMIRTVLMDGEAAPRTDESLGNPLRQAEPNNVAYVIYTSGSTGLPKGVMGTHRSIANRVGWDVGDPDEVYAQKTTPSFIDVLWEIFMPLVRGQRLAILTEAESGDPSELVKALAKYEVTRIVLVPSLVRAVLDTELDLAAQLPKLRYWECSGEALPVALARDFKTRLPGAKLVNVYGASEFWDATAYVVQGKEVGAIPIGQPIPNTLIYLLDDERQLVPTGVVGNLYVGGVSVARGYLGRPEQTSRSFFSDPFCEDAGARMYRSGDLARWSSNGTLELVGRNDHQVKLRGFRVELGEIESCLVNHGEIREAVVVLHQATSQDPRLVAYVVPKTPGQDDLGKHLLTYLRAALPDYMVPTAFIQLAEFPLTISGKIDRMALSAAEVEGHLYQPYEPPIGEIEHTLSAVIMEILSVDRVGRNDDFFQLGGNSLAAVKLVSKLRRLGLNLNVRTLFKASTLASLASETRRSS